MKFKITTPIIEPTEGSPHLERQSTTSLFSLFISSVSSKLLASPSPIYWFFSRQLSSFQAHCSY
ncbi:MAG: hypothetical protein BM561_02370 [Vibrio sp. MedPE-SWchi]|nr:MAG: hypothetical protein BM561_02370 [Vibrio sp. MedPE-SWchi]